MADFHAPQVRCGDTVCFYHDPFNDSCSPRLAFVLSDSMHNDAVNLLVFTEEAGFVHKLSIRHRANPELREKSSWAMMGGWDLSPMLRDLKRVSEVKAAAIRESEMAAAKDKKSGRNS
jgi:hypothetical protein